MYRYCDSAGETGYEEHRQEADRDPCVASHTISEIHLRVRRDEMVGTSLALPNPLAECRQQEPETDRVEHSWEDTSQSVSSTCAVRRALTRASACSAQLSA